MGRDVQSLGSLSRSWARGPCGPSQGPRHRRLTERVRVWLCPGTTADRDRRPVLGPDAWSVLGSERDSSLQAAKYLRTQDLAGQAGLQAQLLPATRHPFSQGVWEVPF